MAKKIGEREYKEGLKRESFGDVQSDFEGKGIVAEKSLEGDYRYQVWVRVVDKDGNTSYGYSNNRSDKVFENFEGIPGWEFEDAKRQAAARARKAGGGATNDVSAFEVDEVGVYLYSKA